MTHRERQLAAIRHEETDHVSIDAVGFEILQQMAGFLGIPENEVLTKLDFDGRVIPLNLLPYSGPKPVINSELDVTEWGTLRSGDYGMHMPRPLAGVTTVTEIEKYNWPDSKFYGYDYALEMSKGFGGKYALRGPSWMPLFCRTCDLFGIEEALVNMLTEPELYEAALERIFNVVYETCGRLLDTCGEYMDIFYVADDFATQRGMMMSPEDWRKYFKPLYAKLFALGKKHGKFVWFHSCGDITDVLPDLIDIGMDVWETVQLHTLPITPEKLKQEFGRHITFFGAVNTQRLPFMTSSEITQQVRYCIDVLGKGGGYICGGDHHIREDVSPEKVITLYETALNHRRKP